MSGDQKQQLVLELQNLGYYVAMCGDGANDCGALKAAHTGISLSEAESSVASPFTSREPNISCVPKVIKEGRAALTTSFGVFKFMVAYSLTEFLSVIILYGIDSNLTSFQFLFIDICLVVNFASFFGKTEAYDGPLFKTPPMTSLLSPTPLCSLVIFMCITVLFQYMSFFVIQTYDWYVPFKFDPTKDTLYTCLENYAVYSLSLFQYITMAIIFSKGKPYRKAFYTNLTFLTSIIVMIIVCVYATVYPAKWILDLLEMELPPSYDARIIILAMAFVNFVVCLLFETFFVDLFINEKLIPSCKRNNKKSSVPYLTIEKELEGENWKNLGKVLVKDFGEVHFIGEKSTKHNFENFTTKL